jgi:transposase
MAPLDEAPYHYVMDCHKLHTDDSGSGACTGQKERKPGVSGRMYVTTEAQVHQIRQRHGSPSRQTGRENILSNTLRHYHGVLQADAFAGYDRLFSPEREGGPLTKPHVGPMPAEKSMMSI